MDWSLNISRNIIVLVKLIRVGPDWAPVRAPDWALDWAPDRAPNWAPDRAPDRAPRRRLRYNCWGVRFKNHLGFLLVLHANICLNIQLLLLALLIFDRQLMFDIILVVILKLLLILSFFSFPSLWCVVTVVHS